MYAPIRSADSLGYRMSVDGSGRSIASRRYYQQAGFSGIAIAPTSSRIQRNEMRSFVFFLLVDPRPFPILSLGSYLLFVLICFGLASGFI